MPVRAASRRITAAVDQAGDRGQWTALAVSAALLIARVLLDGSSRWALGVLAGLAFTFSFLGLICGFAFLLTWDNQQAWHVRDTWKALIRPDRRAIRRAMRERRPVPEHLLDAARIVARYRLDFTLNPGWLFAALAAQQVPNRSLGWAVGFPVVALTMGAAGTLMYRRVRATSRRVLAQPQPRPLGTDS